MAENRAKENPERLSGALRSLHRRRGLQSKWSAPAFVNFTWDKDLKRQVGPVVEGWPPSKNRWRMVKIPT